LHANPTKRLSAGKGNIGKRVGIYTEEEKLAWLMRKGEQHGFRKAETVIADAARVRKAIRFSSFDVLQSQEKEHGFDEKMPFSESFFRKGKIGTWREKLSEEQAAQIVAEHGEVMKRFGYLTEEGNIVF